MRIQFLAIGAVALLAACSSNDTPMAPTGPTPAMTSTSGAAVSAVTPGSEADLQQNVGDTIHFAFDRSDINAEARTIIQRQAMWLKQYPAVTATVEGNCDERGTREYNLALGERRANAAKKALVALGIDGKRLQTISYGKERPLVAGGDDAAGAQNRRDVLVVN